MDLYAGEQLLLKTGSQVPAQTALAGKKVIALYFSAHWCPPCRQFTPVLRNAYQQYLASTPDPPRAAVVFVSSDRSLQDQLSYMREAHGDWPAVVAGSALAQRLGTQLGVRGIPFLAVISAADGAVVTRDGRRDVMSMGAAAFAHWESQVTGADDVDTSVVDMLNENPPEVKKEAAEILLKLLENVRREPNSLKYRSVKLTNPKIESKLLVASGAFEVLFSVGFEESEDRLVLPMNVPMATLEAFCNAISRVLGDAALQGGAGRGAAAQIGHARPPGPRPPSENQPPRVTIFAHDKASENDFFAKMLMEVAAAASYEDKSAQEEALKVVPVKELETKAKQAFDRALKADPKASPSLAKDLLALELLRWFKEDFFSWVDSPACDACGGKTERLHGGAQLEPNDQEKRDGAARVEGYHCDACPREVRFPRYHAKPAKLLQTRKGRCGEWANCFALICRSMGFDVRHVNDWSDHVWVELWSEAEARWVHADPCENAYDKPLMYEVGWGKPVTYVLATSKDEIQDVTWRYSCDHAAVRLRRRAQPPEQAVRPGWLVGSVLALTKKIQMADRYTDEEKKRLLRRRLLELVELMKEKDKSSATAEEQQGRLSGSLAWRAARGEVAEEDTDEEKFVWRLKDCEVSGGVFHLEYSSVSDRYVRRSAGDEATDGWRAGAKEARDVFRKREADWKMCYLARRAGATKGSVTWEIDLSDTDLCVQSVELDVSSKTFEGGRVVWQLCGGDSCLLPSPGSTLRSEGLAGARTVTLTANVSGGSGDVAWQKAQLFRASETEDADKPQLRILLKLTKV